MSALSLSEQGAFDAGLPLEFSAFAISSFILLFADLIPSIFERSLGYNLDGNFSLVSFFLKYFKKAAS